MRVATGVAPSPVPLPHLHQSQTCFIRAIRSTPDSDRGAWPEEGKTWATTKEYNIEVQSRGMSEGAVTFSRSTSPTPLQRPSASSWPALPPPPLRAAPGPSHRPESWCAVPHLRAAVQPGFNVWGKRGHDIAWIQKCGGKGGMLLHGSK